MNYERKYYLNTQYVCYPYRMYSSHPDVKTPIRTNAMCAICSKINKKDIVALSTPYLGFSLLVRNNLAVSNGNGNRNQDSCTHTHIRNAMIMHTEELTGYSWSSITPFTWVWKKRDTIQNVHINAVIVTCYLATGEFRCVSVNYLQRSRGHEEPEAHYWQQPERNLRRAEEPGSHILESLSPAHDSCSRLHSPHL